MIITNEIDFLASIGVHTGNIFKYVKVSKNLNDEAMAKNLGISIHEEHELESMQLPLEDGFRRKLRCLFI